VWVIMVGTAAIGKERLVCLRRSGRYPALLW